MFWKDWHRSAPRKEFLCLMPSLWEACSSGSGPTCGKRKASDGVMQAGGLGARPPSCPRPGSGSVEPPGAPPVFPFVQEINVKVDQKTIKFKLIWFTSSPCFTAQQCLPARWPVCRLPPNSPSYKEWSKWIAHIFKARKRHESKKF